MYTPWGESQQTRTIAPGIISCSCSGHGGFYVDEARFNAMPPKYQALLWPGRAPNNGAWFEEDSAWVGVVLSYPNELLEYHRRELEAWQALQPQEMQILEYKWNYYECHDRIFYQPDIDWYIAYHRRQLATMLDQARNIYQNWYVNRQPKTP